MRKVLYAAVLAWAGVAATALSIPAHASAFVGVRVGVPVLVAPPIVYPGPYYPGPRYFNPGYVRYGYGYPGYRARYGYGLGYHHGHGWGRPWR